MARPATVPTRMARNVKAVARAEADAKALAREEARVPARRLTLAWCWLTARRRP
jgi:hypothetical protein